MSDNARIGDLGAFNIKIAQYKNCKLDQRVYQVELKIQIIPIFVCIRIDLLHDSIHGEMFHYIVAKTIL